MKNIHVLAFTTNMKKSLVIIALLAFGQLLKTSAQQLRLHGTVEGKAIGKVYLQKYIDRYYEVIDSADIHNAAFNFTTQTAILPEVYGISLNVQDTPLLVFLDKGDISITLNASPGYQGSTVTGSAAHDLYTSFHHQHNTDLSAFIKEHPQSLVSLYILYREYVSRLSSDDIQRNLSLVDPSLQQHRFAKILRDVINTREKTDIGQQAPDFSALTPEGTRVSLHDFLGRGYLLLDFWASWCGPCRKENPNVVTAYHDYKERGFDILAVSLDKNRDAWLKGIQQDQLPYHHVSELKYWDSDIARLYGIRSIPSNLLIDKNGKIVAKNLRDSDLRETLHALLDNRQQASAGTSLSTDVSDEAYFREKTAVLASDSFGGRAPLSPYEDKTIRYIADEFKRLGLLPANGDSYFQDVPLLKVKTRPAGGAIVVKGKNGKTSLKGYDDLVITSVRGEKIVTIPKAGFIFAGFGIDAPEYKWNDYNNLDVKGKIVVVLVNDPGYYNDQLFRGKDMTYYGRWVYKIEEASRKGAAGVLIVHDTKPASYGWEVCQASWGDVNLSLFSENKNRDKVALQGWISQDGARRLFQTAGVDFDQAVEAAKQPGFKAIDLKAHSDVKLQNSVYIAPSHNVAAILPGTDLRDEYVIYSAHWDHFGIGRAIDGDSIYNGASDNASGVGALLALARKFADGRLKPRRNILFLSVTAEEAVLLGSEYYSYHPLVPLKNSIVNINIDGCAPQSKSKNVVLGAAGDVDTDNLVAEVAAAQGRRLDFRNTNAGGGYFRSDHFSFAKVGVPVILVEGGRDWVNPDDAKKYGKRRTYHQPTDEYSDSWDVAGTVDDINLWYGLGLRLANADGKPKWLRQNYVLPQQKKY